MDTIPILHLSTNCTRHKPDREPFSFRICQLVLPLPNSGSKGRIRSFGTISGFRLGMRTRSYPPHNVRKYVRLSAVQTPHASRYQAPSAAHAQVCWYFRRLTPHLASLAAARAAAARLTSSQSARHASEVDRKLLLLVLPMPKCHKRCAVGPVFFLSSGRLPRAGTRRPCRCYLIRTVRSFL